MFLVVKEDSYLIPRYLGDNNCDVVIGWSSPCFKHVAIQSIRLNLCLKWICSTSAVSDHVNTNNILGRLQLNYLASFSHVMMVCLKQLLL
jgi:hypothetical protein